MRQCVSALLLLPCVVASQEVRTVAPGSRVRVTQDHPVRLYHIGTLVGSSADSVTYKTLPWGTLKTLALDNVSRFEVSLGQRRHFGARFGVGLLTGMGGGALLGLANSALASRSSNDDELVFPVTAWTIAGGVVGGVTGAVIGAFKSDTWEEVPSRGWRVGMSAPHNRAFGLQLSRSF